MSTDYCRGNVRVSLFQRFFSVLYSQCIHDFTRNINRIDTNLTCKIELEHLDDIGCLLHSFLSLWPTGVDPASIASAVLAKDAGIVGIVVTSAQSLLSPGS